MIGVNQQIKTRSGGGEGVGFAVPADVVERSLDGLREDGKVRYAYLGVQSVPLYPQLVERFDLPVGRARGCRSSRPTARARRPGCAAATARSRFQDRAFSEGGDIITRIEDRPIDDADDLSEAVQLFDPGQKVTVEVWRDGEKRKLELKLGDRPLSRRASPPGERLAVDLAHALREIVVPRLGAARRSRARARERRRRRDVRRSTPRRRRSSRGWVAAQRAADGVLLRGPRHGRAGKGAAASSC